MTHPGLRAALWRWLDREPEGAPGGARRWLLRLDAERFVYLDLAAAAEDAPFLVRSLRWEGDRALLLLSDGNEEELDYPTVTLSPRGARCVVKGRFDARFSTAAWGALGERLRPAGPSSVLLDARGGPWRMPAVIPEA